MRLGDAAQPALGRAAPRAAGAPRRGGSARARLGDRAPGGRVDGHAAVARARSRRARRRSDRGRRASRRRRRCASRRTRTRRPAGSGAASAVQKSAQHSPSRQERLKRPGAPSEPSRPTVSTCRRTSGWTASGSSCGEPSVTSPQTRSGRRAASTLARPPPRLWPITTARLPCSATTLLEALLEPLEPRRPSRRRWRACPPWRCGSRPAAASWPSGASEPSPARKPGISSTGRPRPSSSPSPRRTGSRSSAAASSPKRASRQSGGRRTARDDDGCLHRGQDNLVPRTAGKRARPRRDRFPAVRAVTIQDGKLVVEQRPDPEPGARRGAGARARRPA